jgi:Coenzyme PQQ synthesis protein D (PqqD)
VETAVTRYRIPDGVLRATVEGEEVLLNEETGVYHLVNQTGRSLIRSFEVGNSLERAVLELARMTGEDQQRVAADASAFVHAMVTRGLLETAPDMA